MQHDAINGAITPCAGDKVAARICGMQQTPRKAAEATVADYSLPSPQTARDVTPRAAPGGSGDAERFTGYGVMGLPFAGGHYLAFRCWPHSSIGPGYRAVWHRDPEGTWTFYATEPPDR